MKNTLIKGFAIFIISILFLGKLSAQFDIPTANLSIVSPSTDGQWNATYNATTPDELTVATFGGAAVGSKTQCNNGSKINALSLSSSDSHWVELSVPTASTATFKEIMFDLVGNSSGGPWTHQIWYSKSSPFDATKAYKSANFQVYGYDAACSDFQLVVPADIKSIRIYKRVKALDNGDGTYTIGSGSGVNLGTGQTMNIFKMYAWLNSGPKITGFTLAGSTSDPINHTSKTITVTVPFATNLSSLVPTFTLASGTSLVVPADATTPRDFSTPQTYQVTDGVKTETYTVTVSKTPASTAKAITAFNLSGYTGTINEGAKTISIVVPYSSSFPITATPTVTVSSLASLQTTGDQTFNEGVPVNFSVQAEDGSTQIYQATVTKAPASTACNINSFSTGYATETVIIDQIAKTISVTVSSTNDITNLSPIVGNSALSSIASPAFPTDFTNPVSITVLAEDGVTSKTYTVTTVKDGISPILTSSTPSDTQTAVSLAGIITLNYDEDVVLGSGTISISGGSLGTPVITGNKVKIPFSGLTSLTAYSITVPAGMFTDKFGNQAASSTINFTTADGENHATWYASYMDAENFAIPAFISPASAYVDSIDVKAASINQYGAYKLSPGDTLTITTDSVGYASIIAYSLAANRTVTISNSANASVSSYTFYEYENRGATLSQLIDVANETTPTKIYIVNTSVSGDIFIPYISLSEVGSAAPLDEKIVFCK